MCRGLRHVPLDSHSSDNLGSMKYLKIQDVDMCNLFVVITIFFLMGWTIRVVAEEQTVNMVVAKNQNKSKSVSHDCSFCPKMVTIPAGSITMGSRVSEIGRIDNESPMHEVSIASFDLGKTEITRGEFSIFVKDAGYIVGKKCFTIDNGKYELRTADWNKIGYTQNDNHPAICISWDDAKAYAAWLSNKTGKQYRLPTEAEWEYASRAKTLAARYWGESPDSACKNANVADKTVQVIIKRAATWLVHNCEDGYAFSAPTGSFKPNAFGLYDMLGNVWEWVEDGYHPNYQGAPVDGSAWVGNGKKHILRGGSWYDAPRFVRAAGRDKAVSASRYDNIGFRIARTRPQVPL